ncbi:MAG: hypothetical protein JWQ98_2603 [Chlorobi bacterium]|nr:hypothetical protein [Chlorobiota bacterium]
MITAVPTAEMRRMKKPMNINPGRANHSDPIDAEIERDLAELRGLLAGVEGPKEPHPAYWQNFVVRVRGRLDEEGFRKRRKFSTAWVSVGAAAVIAAVAITSVLNTGGTVPGGPIARTKVVDQPAEAASASMADAYAQTGTKSLVLSESDVQMVNAIVSNNDDAIFEAMVSSDQL